MIVFQLQREKHHDHNWNQFVLGFNNDSQSDLIKDIFGEVSRKSLTHFLLATLSAIALFLALLFLPYKRWFLRRHKSHLDKMLLSFKKEGFEKQVSEPLQHFYDRISPQLNEDSKQLMQEYTKMYYSLRYGQSYEDENTNESSLSQLANRLIRIGKKRKK